MNIKELAERAGANVLETSAWTIIQLNTGDQTKFLERFAELVAAAASAKEREACAKDCCDAEEEARRNERYIKEMEQPVPKQSGVMSITVSKVCEADALPPTSNAVYWMDMVVANLVRNGVNKHRARELAYHFYTYTTPRENNNG